MQRVRWGIIGTARIAANVFIPALRTVRGAELTAVASRDTNRAETFASTHGAKHAFGSYLDLLNSPNIDAVYIPLPNSEHERWTHEAAQRSIPVFCEKPLTKDSASAARITARCRKLKVPLVEAFVFRYHPQTQVLCELLSAGRIGTISQITAHQSFFFDRAEGAKDYRMDPAMGGGGLLDVVCYPIAYIRHVLGAEPLTVQAAVRYDTKRGIDDASSLIMEFPDGVQATATGGFDDYRHRGVTITGNAGLIHLPEPYHPPHASEIRIESTYRQDTIKLDNDGPAFAPAITHFQDHLQERGSGLLTTDFAAGTLRVIEAAHESARLGARVSLS